jgi:hypothetical protein
VFGTILSHDVDVGLGRDLIVKKADVLRRGVDRAGHDEVSHQRLTTGESRLGIYRQWTDLHRPSEFRGATQKTDKETQEDRRRPGQEMSDHKKYQHDPNIAAQICCLAQLLL